MRQRTKSLFIFLIAFNFSVGFISAAFALQIKSIVKPGITKEELLQTYPLEQIRTSRKTADEEWITYLEKDLITFYLKENTLIKWTINDREEVVREYLSEFCSQGILQSLPKMTEAITKALNGIPQKAFINVTDRRRPVLITDYNSSGMSRFATSSDIISLPDDPPAFQDGMTLIKLSTELEEGTVQGIEGVILHELAHRALDHVRQKKHTCAMEREANQLVKKWGFAEEFSKAKESFGDKQRDGNENCK